MANVLIDRQSLQVKGLNRDPLPFEYEIKLPTELSLQKTIQVSTGNKVQKTNDTEEPLYMDNIVKDANGNITSYDEVTTSQKVIAYTTQTFTYKVPDPTQTTKETVTNPDGTTSEVDVPVMDTISTTSQVPSAWKDLDPVMIDEVIPKAVTLANSCTEFAASEVISGKIAAINNLNLRQVLFFSEDLNEDAVLKGSSQGVHTGQGFIALDPGGFLQTDKIALSSAAETLEVYLESQDSIEVSMSSDSTTFVAVQNSTLSFTSEVQEIYLKFTNTASSRREIYAFGILG